mmetsp:Transcript_104/g.301  ORF Transcript_104/g.301 Transcript_104/m.301 type:complete len:227 (+) Transcript_104:1225-1905(+)
MSGRIDLQSLIPPSLERCSGTLLPPGVCCNIVGYFKRAVIPAQLLAQPLQFFLAKRATMNLTSSCFGWSSVSDGGAHFNQRGPSVLQFCSNDRIIDSCNITIAIVYFKNMPTVRAISCGHVLGKRNICRSVNRYRVVIVQDDELSKLPVGCKGACFGGDALHKTAVSNDAVREVVDDLGRVRLIVRCSQVLLRKRHSNSIGDALPKSAGHYFYPWGHIIFGMAGRA